MVYRYTPPETLSLINAHPFDPTRRRSVAILTFCLGVTPITCATVVEGWVVYSAPRKIEPLDLPLYDNVIHADYTEVMQEKNQILTILSQTQSWLSQELPAQYYACLYSFKYIFHVLSIKKKTFHIVRIPEKVVNDLLLNT